MKRGSQNLEKLRSQKILDRQEIHYERVQEVSMSFLKNEVRAKRLDIIIEKGISKTSGMMFPGGIAIPIRHITMERMIVLDNYDEIDPLNL